MTEGIRGKRRGGRMNQSPIRESRGAKSGALDVKQSIDSSRTELGLMVATWPTYIQEMRVMTRKAHVSTELY